MRPVKREPAAAGSLGARSRGAAAAAADDASFREVQRERVVRERESSGEDHAAEEEEGPQDLSKRRVLRSRYLAVIHEISERREDLSKDLDKFNVIIDEVEKLHEQVQKPREQVADAEALQDIANSLVTSIRSQSNEGVTPSEFVSCLLREFAQIGNGVTSEENDLVSVSWKDIGRSVSSIFMNGHGCCTMLGPMGTQLKQRKTVISRKRSKPTESSRPAEVEENGSEEKTDTDKNMTIMFIVLRRNKRVKLEHLILNRRSFAQTVENLFALSFLVKDGRAEITIDKSGSHFVSPKNAPAHSSIMSHEVSYSHFVFRFDFNDWKRMAGMVPDGEELMPHRDFLNSAPAPQAEAPADDNSEAAGLPTTPIRKLSRNRGLVVQSVVEDSPDNGAHSGPTAILRCKRKLSQGMVN